MNTPKLILTDLDGTLLRNDKRLSPANRAALERASAQGCQVVLATGRSYASLPPELRTLPFLRYFIFMNGAKVYDLKSDRVLYRAEIDGETAERLLDLLEPLDLSVDCYQQDRGYIDQRYYQRLDYYITDPIAREHSRRSRTPLADFRSTVRAGGSVQKFQCFFPHPELTPAVVERLQREFPQLEISSSLPSNLEINAPGANKGAGLLALCRELDMTPADAVAFGDGTNDLTMLRQAGIGVAMGNADPEVLASADQIAPSNQEDGVAQVLSQWF